MTYKLCRLYGLKSKKTLLKWLDINDASFFHSVNISNHYHPYIECNDGKKRLVEPPCSKLKIVQSKILRMLQRIKSPQYLFSGIKGKSFIDNAKQHSGIKYIYKIDISKFFPNTSRNKVYRFFLNKLNTSPDVASILTDCTTIDLRNCSSNKHYHEIINFLKDTNIKQIAHLPTGAPTSMLLSFWANQSMFEKLNLFCADRNYVFTVYADDVVISSIKPIPYPVRCAILAIIEKYGFSISKKKEKYI